MKVNLSVRSSNQKRKISLAIVTFICALAIPTAVLVIQTYGQLNREAYYRHRALAEEFAIRLDKKLAALIAIEEDRSFSEYNFIVASGAAQNSFMQRSPISELPSNVDFPGIIGYFQVGPEGELTSPVIPSSPLTIQQLGLSEDELVKRRQNYDKIFTILNENQLVSVRIRNQSVAEEKREEQKSTHSSNSVYSGEEANKLLDRFQNVPRQNEYGDQKSIPYENENINTLGQPGSAGRAESQKAFDDLARDLETDSTQRLSKFSSRISELDTRENQNVQLESAPISPRQFEKEVLKNKINPQQYAKKRSSRTEQSILPEIVSSPHAADQQNDEEAEILQKVKVRIFESEIDPFKLSLLNSGHFVVYRKVWRENTRFIQGFLIDADELVRQGVASEFQATVLSGMSTLSVTYKGESLSQIEAAITYSYLSRSEVLDNTQLYNARLSSPFDEFELIFTINKIPLGKESLVLFWAAAIIFLVLILGGWFFVRLAIKQLALSLQQQNFVSAVSHELRTPLTSIRMYGEILKQGWADEVKKNEYYDYIYYESERLTRLINNVLQLSKVTRNDLEPKLRVCKLSELADLIMSKIASQLERADMQCKIEWADDSKHSEINIDVDLFIQIVINLVDNAIKFSAKAESKNIDIAFFNYDKANVGIKIRDYGPGIPNKKLQHIFTLFYRLENELTRETSGTGIGLALVQQFTRLMGGKIEVKNTNPGVEFVLKFPIYKSV